MKILFLTPHVTFSPDSGGLIKSQHLIRFLAENHTLTIGCLYKSTQEHENLTEFRKSLPSVPVFAKPLNISRSPFNFLRSCLAGKPLTTYRNYCADFGRTVFEHCKNIDVIFIDHYLMSQYVPAELHAKIVVHQHNAEFLIWERRANLEHNWLLKKILDFEANRIKKYELRMCHQADAILATNNDQRSLIQAGAPKQAFYETLHIGIEENLNKEPLEYESSTLSLLFIGTLTWEPNIDAITWFADKVWPLLVQTELDVKIDIVGRFKPGLESKLKKKMPDAQICGFVDDLEPYYQKNKLLIAPMRFGSGVKIKIVNAFYRGIPVVTTSIGAEGLSVINGEHLLVADTPDDYAQSILSVLTQPDLWQSLSTNARSWSRDNYSWEQEKLNIQKGLGDEYTA